MNLNNNNSKINKKIAKQNNKSLKDIPKHDGHRKRMYAKYRDSRFYDFEPHEVLEMILYNCYMRRNTNDIAYNLLKYFDNNLENVLNADIDELIIAGLTERSAIVISQFKEVEKFVHYYNRVKCNDKIVNSDSIGSYCASRFGYETVEALHVICLDSRYKIRGTRTLSVGNEEETEANPINILRAAMIFSSKNIVLCHNHPTGDIEPSNPDVINTLKIAHFLNTAGVNLIDHIICYRDRYTSFSERGLLTN